MSMEAVPAVYDGKRDDSLGSPAYSRASAASRRAGWRQLGRKIPGLVAPRGRDSGLDCGRVSHRVRSDAMPPPVEQAPLPAASLSRWFTEEVQPHEPHLRSYLRRAFPGVRDVDDVVQESYLRLWRKQAARPLGSARAFLFRVARNFAIDLLREHRPVAAHEAPEGIFDEGADVAVTVELREFEALLTEALDALTPRHREVVALCKLQRQSPREVAARLRISEKTVNEHLYRGLQRLGEELKRRGLGSTAA